ncbi:MAG: lysophospholipid acyltransferase family protein [Deltaproteobacteria bacterium]|nr:lysophospholipid acyltransferase family protein [Deltaproteobacteria bacterium]
MNKPQNSGNYIALLLLFIFNLISRIIPLKLWLFFGKIFGLFFYLVDPNHRKIVLINLRFAYGKEKNEKELKAIAISNFMHYGMMGFEWIHMMRLTRKGMDKLKSRIRVEGEEHLIAARKKNPSVIILSAHFGNWEYAHLYFADTFNRLNFIVRMIDNPLIEKERVFNNENFGVGILYKENGLRPAIKKLKNGEDLVIFSDRKANLREGIPCHFFNQKASTIPLIFSLASKYHIPVVPMFIYRTKDVTKHRLVFFPEMNIEGLDMTQATQLQNDTIEKAIREQPELWLWIHRKWKCYHEEIYS